MATLTARAVLDMWEQAVGLPPCSRALQLWLMLSGKAVDSDADVTVGNCDRALIAAHRALFGKQIVGRTDCPQCQEMLELDLDLDIFDLPRPTQCDGQLTLDGVEISWRFPTARDLSEVSRTRKGVEATGTELLRRCVTTVRHEQRILEYADWPDGLAAELGNAMTAADPLLDPRIELTCAACEHEWSVRFDITTFLWREIEEVARRLMSEVHRLASAYGWSEREILELTAARRAAYLQMCSS